MLSAALQVRLQRPQPHQQQLVLALASREGAIAATFERRFHKIPIELRQVLTVGPRSVAKRFACIAARGQLPRMPPRSSRRDAVSGGGVVAFQSPFLFKPTPACISSTAHLLKAPPPARLSVCPAFFSRAFRAVSQRCIMQLCRSVLNRALFIHPREGSLRVLGCFHSGPLAHLSRTLAVCQRPFSKHSSGLACTKRRKIRLPLAKSSDDDGERAGDRCLKAGCLLCLVPGTSASGSDLC